MSVQQLLHAGSRSGRLCGTSKGAKTDYRRNPFESNANYPAQAVETVRNEV
jgi:hypothetical protein